MIAKMVNLHGEETMTREEAKELYTPKSTYPMKMSFIDKIYDDFEARTCESCKYGNNIDGKDILLCGNAVCLDLTTYGQYVVTKNFGCNTWRAK